MQLQPNLIIDRRQDYKSTYGDSHFDATTGHQVIKLFSGDYYISTQPKEMLATILGSCVSACVRDPVAGIGGMNHFLLPGEGPGLVGNGEATRYGVFAMESLINGILKAGGRKDRLEVKVFGGGNVINNSARIGSKNAAFIRAFLQEEGLRITSEDLEGDLPRRIHYFPETGQVMMRKLRRKEDLRIADEEAKYTRSLVSRPIEGEIDLF
ncbi:MAG: chemoreceptor glutamine deamidase CheD [Alphaproteobacteria bacterium]|nr:chemoreceptor glutamine deamidase CheD [Alphaproteobacteria bacterium]